MRNWITSSLALSCLMTGCVSVRLAPTPSATKADVKAVPPQPPFRQVESLSSDQAWKNPQTGSIISFLSDCSPTADLSLESLREEVALSLNKVRIASEARYSYQEREALRSKISGDVDGISTTIDLVVFKRNGCSYHLSLISKPQHLSSDQPAFENFLSGFKAP